MSDWYSQPISVYIIYVAQGFRYMTQGFRYMTQGT